MSEQSVTAKDEALQAVGRTVVNFQRLEHNLKLAARLGPVSGTLPKLQRDVEKRIAQPETMTLGHAIQAWLKATDGDAPASSHTPDLFDATIQMTFSLSADAESHSAHAAALKALRETRNELIHGGLVHFDWDSPEECRRLLKNLDEVNEAIRAELAFITAILSALDAARAEALEAAWSELERRASRAAPTDGDA